MRIAYFGNGVRGVKCLEALFENGFDICAVVVHYQAPNNPAPTSVRFFANKLKIPVYEPQNVNSIDFIEVLKIIDPDLLILSGYNQIFQRDLLRLFPRSVINLHGGYLPYYRGGSPINWQIINGEKVGGCGIINIDEGIDTGDIISQEIFTIDPDESAGEVIKKTLDIFPRVLVDVVKQIREDRVIPIKQDINRSQYFCKRYPKDGLIFWDRMTAFQVHNLVRGLRGPELPGAFSFLNGRKIIIWKTLMINGEIKGVPGRIALKEDNGVVVIAKDKGILVAEIKIDEDPKVISAKNYFRICGLTFK